MVRVRKMRVRVRHRLMVMRMRMAGARRDVVHVLMLMVRIVRVLVFVIEDLVSVQVLVTLGEMQPDTAGHQQASREKSGCYGFIEEHDCDERAREGRG